MGQFDAGLPTQNQASKTALVLPKSAPLFIREFTVSGSWTAPGDGVLVACLFGAGGTGAVLVQAAAAAARATGGGAGGTAIKAAKVKAGTVFNFTLGAGGALVTRTTAGATNGNPGGTSTFTGGLFNLIATGGGGGNAALGTAAILGGIGGIGSGGDINWQGGNGGDVAANTSTVGFSTGGGAPGLFGTGFRGGNFNSTVLGLAATTGGGGAGGTGGDQTANLVVATGGGGAYSSGVTDALTGGSGSLFSYINGVQPNFFGHWPVYTAGGTGQSGATSGNVSGAGVGSGGATGNVGTSGSALLGGGGGVVSSTGACASGLVSWVGGTGAITATATGANAQSAGKGGDGVLLLAFYPGN
jgi:hypothetical protein